MTRPSVPARKPAGLRKSASTADRAVFDALTLGRQGAKDDPLAAEMAKNRRVNGRRTAASGSGTELSLATGRPMDPMFYWKQNNLPYDVHKAGELEKIRAYCSDPAELVWMGDYSFKPIGEIQAGDVVIGWSKPEPGVKSRLVRSTVLATQRRLAPETVKVTTESGRTWTGTPDHRFANPHFSPGQTSGNRGWRQPEWVNPTEGTVLRHVIDPTEPLTSEKERLVAAWLGGIYDGEGTMPRIAQCPDYNPAVYQRIADSLDFLGFSYTREKFGIRLSTGMARGGNGRSRKQIVDFLNWTDPVRREMAAVDKILLTGNYGSQDRVVEVESRGPGEVVSMETTTGTYVVSGFASSNCRILYMTHPIIASAIDVYSKYPLTGMELVCKDDQLTDFYTTLMFDQLGYEDYLIDIGREYWTVGEAWPLGSFNETLGVWEDDELINPDDVDVIRSPFLKEPRFQMRLPESLRTIIDNRAPKWEFEALMRSYPELKNFVGDNARMPVSNVLLKQLKFKGDSFHPRGVPILMRGFRAVMQEEMLNAAQDAVASRLYTPLVLAKLGASASDLGTQSPWIPSPEDLEDFQEALDAALAGDFRVLIHHFATSMETVFGRENMPQMDADFDRLTDRQLQVFGLSKTMLTGAEAGETYAADAINRDLISQLLTNYQRLIKQFTRDRMLVVAEAQEHYDYEERGGKRYPIMEEVLEVDEESGEQRIVEQPKLLVPDLHIKAMTMKDEQEQRAFYETLRASGVPISMKSRMINVPLDLKDEIDRTRQENVDLAVEAQETRKAMFTALRDKGLPIPDDLKADFMPKAHGAGGGEGEVAPSAPAAQVALQAGMLDPNTQALAPTPEEVGAAQAQGLLPATGVPGSNVVPLTRNKALQQPDGATRPPESDEMRASMPKPASLITTNEGGQKVAEVLTPAEYGEDGKVTKAAAWTEVVVEDEGSQSMMSDPKHIGMRRQATARFPKDKDGNYLPLPG